MLLTCYTTLTLPEPPNASELQPSCVRVGGTLAPYILRCVPAGTDPRSFGATVRAGRPVMEKWSYKYCTTAIFCFAPALLIGVFPLLSGILAKGWAVLRLP